MQQGSILLFNNNNKKQEAFPAPCCSQDKMQLQELMTDSMYTEGITLMGWWHLIHYSVNFSPFASCGEKQTNARKTADTLQAIGKNLMPRLHL